MDNNTPPALPERNPTPSILNGGVGPNARRPSPGPGPPTSPIQPGGGNHRPASLMDNSGTHQVHMVHVVVNRDERGYGMKVSGDNPVYVQSVKEGGAAEKAGLHAGDKIIKVNGVNVMSSTHTQVVALIRASSQVVLSVQQRSTSRSSIGSPSMHNRPATTPNSQRITGPQPVDNEKQCQLQREKEQYYRLMIEKERHYIDLLRSQIATSPDEKKYAELAKTEKNLQTLQSMLQRSQSEQSPPSSDNHILNSKHSPFAKSPSPTDRTNNWTSTPSSPNGNSEPPPLPKRNNYNLHQNKNFNTIPTASAGRSNKHGGSVHVLSTPNSPIDVNMINNQINDTLMTPTSTRKMPHLQITSNNSPPPLPPRTPQSAPVPSTSDPDAVNSINNQMSYPLVATCATLVNDYSPSNPTHHRTKSSPESLLLLSGAEASKKLIASESMSDLSRQDGNWEGPETPPGTPPPPYPSPLPPRRDRHLSPEDGFSFMENMVDGSPDFTNFRSIQKVVANSSPIHAANPQLSQQNIISMEDDEISDLEINQVEDHGHFRSLSRLWEHLPHLAVFTNYVLSNSDPNSLLFYLLTDLYKEGNAKDMRKWAFEIHSCFLVPGAPLRLSNVDENIAREIDDVLTKEFDKEEILRKIFWKARSRAKEELTKQLSDFQQKRTAGLGTIFGPTDQALLEVYHDKSKEIKLYETLFLEKLEPYLEEVEKESYDARRYYTAAALTTVLTRIFQIRPTSHALDRCPTFVSKEKSLKNRLMGKYSRKLTINGHQYVAQQYYTVINCTNCHQIIYGIGPQGYQCSACHINLHRTCVKLYEDTCPGPMNKKDRGFKFIRMRQENNDNRRKQSTIFLQMEKERRQMEERDSSFDLNESGDSTRTGQPVSRSGSDRRPDAVREERHHQEAASGGSDPSHDPLASTKEDTITPESSERIQSNKKSTNVKRSESVKEQTEKRKQRRNVSDPSHNNTSGDVDLEHSTQPGFSNPDSSSSSNSSISTNGRLSESPSNSVDAVEGDNHKTGSDSDTGFESDIPMWHNFVSEEERKSLDQQEQKRQDIINELFSTEHSHVRNLRVLYKIFYDKLKSNSAILSSEQLNLIFPNMKEVFEIHNEFNKEMKKRREEDKLVKEVGDLLMNMFDGTQGESLKKAAAKFCEKQQLALELIKDKRKRDSKFDNLLIECEKKRHCRRLQLQGILPSEMQRLSKYPLLLERLIKNVESSKDSGSCKDSGDVSIDNEELNKLKLAHQRSKEILNFVNESVKLSLNSARLEDIQRHLDTTNYKNYDQEFKNIDLTKYKMILEGPMQLKRANKANLNVHILLLEEAVFILQKDGEKYLLKSFQVGGSLPPLSPIIKTNLLLVRSNAVCKNGLYLVNTSSSNIQMYDLIADDDAKRDVWFKHFSDAVETYNKRDGKSKTIMTSGDSDSECVSDIPEIPSGRAEQVAHPENKEENIDRGDTTTPTNETENDEEEKEERVESPDTVSGGGGDQKMPKVTAEEWPLILPSQVHVDVPSVHTAESMVTLLEQIKRKDAEVRQALEDKEHLVADLLHIPREDFQHIADMASVDVQSSRDPCERLMSAIYQVDQLKKLINDTLNISESDAVIAKGSKIPACASQTEPDRIAELAVPVNAVQSIITPLSLHLNALLADFQQAEQKEDRLRKEVAKMRECLHEQTNLHGPTEESTSDEYCDFENAQESLDKNEESEDGLD